MNDEYAGEVQKRRTGRRKLAGLVVLALVVVVGGLIWLAMPPEEPAYQDKPLSYWLTNAIANGGNIYDLKNPRVIESTAAVRHIGTNAIPILLRKLRAKDSTFKIEVINLVERQNYIHVPDYSVEGQKLLAEVGFYLLGELATNAVPDLLDIYAHPSSFYSKLIADTTLTHLYPAPCVATPYWVPASNRVDWYLEAAKLKELLGEETNALSACSAAIKLDPTNAEAYLERGDVKFQLQDFTGAIMDIEKNMELSPSNEAAFYSRGLCKYALKNFKGAETDFTAANELETNAVAVYNYRGLARANLREFNDALADFNKAVELSPKSPEYYRNRAVVEALQKDFELALADASKSIELDSRDPIAYASRGRIKNALKDYQAALLDFDKALELNPKDSVAYSSRAASSIYMDDFDSAAADLENALQLDPKSVTAFVARGVMATKRGGEDDAALADFERAVELAPKVPETYGMLGLFRYKIHQWEPALANCQKALKLGSLANVTDLNSYIWLLHTQSGEDKAANEELEVYLNSLDGTKTNEWGGITARFFIGSLPESNLLSLATTAAKRPSAVKSQVCDSFYYAGMKRKLAGDKQGAKGLFQKCLDTKDDNSFAYMNAGVEMRALMQP